MLLFYLATMSHHIYQTDGSLQAGLSTIINYPYSSSLTLQGSVPHQGARVSTHERRGWGEDGRRREVTHEVFSSDVIQHGSVYLI